jgi:hypothetical protein
MADKKISALTGAATPLAGTEVLPIVQSGSTVKVAVSNLTAGRAVSAASLALTSPLPATSGGTGQSSAFTTDAIPYATSTTQLNGNSTLTWTGHQLQLANIDYTAKTLKLLPNTNDAAYFTTIVDNINNGTTISKVESGFVTTTLYLHDGNVTNNNGNFVIGTSGKGIDFSATPGTGTSELLADYEEGTFTPNLTFGGGNTGMAGTFTGNYTKVGNQVTVDIRIALTAKGSSTGIAVIGVLPFSAKAYPCAVIDASSGVVGPATTWLGAVGGTDMYLFYQDVTTRTLYSQANFTDTADLRLGLTYLV